MHLLSQDEGLVVYGIIVMFPKSSRIISNIAKLLVRGVWHMVVFE